MDFLFPSLKTDNPVLDRAFRIALGNLAGNVQPNRSGLLQHEVPCIFPDLDGHAPEPVDSSLNVGYGAALIIPKISKNTLLSVLARDQEGRVTISGEKAESVIWISAVWQYYLMTADREFLKSAFEASRNSLEWFENKNFCKSEGLFRSDVKEAKPVLPINSLFAEAYKIIPLMEKVLGWEHGGRWAEKSTALKAAIKKKIRNACEQIGPFQPAMRNGKELFALARNIGQESSAKKRLTLDSTSLMHAVFTGLFGMRFSTEGLNFEPLLLAGIGTASLNGFHYMNAVIDITVAGEGSKIISFRMNGKAGKAKKVQMKASGHLQISIVMSGKKVKGG